VTWAAACSKTATSPTPPPAPTTASLTATFDESPVPFKTTGCSFSTPQGWYTNAKIQEANGFAVTVTSLTQKLDGSVATGALDESFNSRFGACGSDPFTPDVIAAKGAVCGVVGVCTTSSYANYQFSIAGTDANGHAIAFNSPVLQFAAK